MIKTAVIANTYLMFLQWCREHDVNPRSREVFFVSSAIQLRGYLELHVVDIGYMDRETPERTLRRLVTIHREIRVIAAMGRVTYGQEPWREEDPDEAHAARAERGGPSDLAGDSVDSVVGAVSPSQQP